MFNPRNWQSPDQIGIVQMALARAEEEARLADAETPLGSEVSRQRADALQANGDEEFLDQLMGDEELR